MFEPEHEVWNEYETALRFKNGIGRRGISEQAKMNERFFIGDQWHGARIGKDRPLVRHNIIKRIGEYKISQILSDPVSVRFKAVGISEESTDPDDRETLINVKRLTKHFTALSERLKMQNLSEQILRNAYVSGTGVLYTYWDAEEMAGGYADKEKKNPIRGDIACEVLDIADVFFADPYGADLQKQPYIILKTCRPLAEVVAFAKKYSSDPNTSEKLKSEAVNGKVTVLTKLFQAYKNDGTYTIKSVTVSKNAILRKPFDTGLTLYPIAVFPWEKRGGMIYGESEITYLIPNQIAINRMLTANVWATMTKGMPMMIVNGDLVPGGITNEPGQILKIYGGKEEMDGAVRYITPPDFSANFTENMESLIRNTLTQSGANEVALGDSTPQNASALITMRNAAIMPVKIIKSRFYTFLEEVARIWADFWICYYGSRKIELLENDGVRYEAFCPEDYQNVSIRTYASAGGSQGYSDRETYQILLELFEKGAMTKAQLIERIPDAMISDKDGLLAEIHKEEENRDGI